MSKTNLEATADSILKTFPTKSVVKAVTAANPVEIIPISAKEIMIVLVTAGNIVISGVTFVCTASTPYTFKNIADLRTIVPSVNAAVIYYPAFSQFPPVTPNNV